MKISILDDYHDTLRSLECFRKLAGHEVKIWTDHVREVDALAERVKDAEALVLIRERTKIRAPLLEEPITSPSYPLFQLSNVVCTPHIGYVSRDEYEIQR